MIDLSNATASVLRETRSAGSEGIAITAANADCCQALVTLGFVEMHTIPRRFLTISAKGADYLYSQRRTTHAV